MGGCTTDEEARRSFNELVRVSLARPLAAAVRLKYLHCVAIWLFSIVPNGFEANAWRYNDGLQPAVCNAMINSTWAFGLFPLLCYFAWKWCAQCLHLSGCRELAFLALAFPWILTYAAIFGGL